jgi:tetratricopeptide (TPR) repeat protein
MIEAWLERATLHLARAELAAAAQAYDHASALGAATFALHYNRSVIAAKFGELELALRHALAAVAVDPGSLLAQVNAAVIEGPVRGYETALARLDAAALLGARDPSLQRARAQTLFKLTHFEQALAAAEGSIAIDPLHPLGYELRVVALKALGRDAELFAAVSTPGIAAPSARLLVHRAVLEMEAGHSGGAPALLRAALGREPHLAWAWFNLAEVAGCDGDGADIAAMERLLERDDLTANDRVLLHFALGKAHLTGGDHASAFPHFDRGNALKRGLLAYDVAQDERAMLELAREFPAAALSQGNPSANFSERPIFIVGMPRSGTSLVEQLLASHPAVFGAGELPALPDLLPQCRLLDRAAWPSLAACYLKTAGAHAAEAERIVDKLPLNFLNVGLIRMLFPNARVIHCRRDSVDTGLSCYLTLFDEGHEFSYDLTELGRFTRAYEPLMEHWRNALPADRFLDIDYEALVTDTEHAARRLVAFCGLPWDGSVLRFYQTQRAVRTASKLQVRQPIYRTSVNRARAFGSALDPLRAALRRVR